MKKINFLVIAMIFQLSISFGQAQLDQQYFQLNPASLSSDVYRSGLQDISLGNKHIQALFVENDIMSDEFQKSNPDILSYDLKDADGNVFGNITINPHGVWMNYWENNKLIVVIPNMDTSDPNDHYIDNNKSKIKHHCENTEINNKLDEIRSIDIEQISGSRGTKRNGDLIRTYRMAIACTGEFYELNGNNDSNVNAVIVSSIAGLTAIYLRELSIKFTLIGTKLYKNKNTDPFDPTSNDNRTIQAGRAVAMNFGPASYDIGHALHKSFENDGWTSGGVAQVASVCRETMNNGSPAKAKGWSGSYQNAGYSWFSLFGHEIGHMFSARHTFNGTGESCTDAISETTAYEIGSGITIMSYNGICDDAQNTPNNGESDNYFHIASLLQITDHAEGTGSCASTTASNNNIPDITANPCGNVVRIPKNTLFVLKGEGVDDDGDEIYYSWEQFDEDGNGTPTQGLIGNAASNSNKAPLFKNIPPSPEQLERYFPDLKTITAGVTSDKFQALPKRARTLHFKLVGRDFKTNGGAYGFDDLEIEVVNEGPLVMDTHNSGTYAAGEMTELRWNTNGTEALCQKVGVKLSINGGLSFNIIIAEDIDYSSGMAMIQIPEFLTATNDAKLMLSCEDSQCAKFFDISNGNFNITSDCEAPGSYICPSEDLAFDQGDPGLNLNLEYTTGIITNSITKQTNLPGYKTVTYNTDGASCKVVADLNGGANEEIISVSETGNYVFNIDYEFSGGFGFVSIFNNATYSSSNPCSSFVSSSGTWGGSTTSVFAAASFSTTLEACQEYKIVFFNYGGNRTKIESINGPGLALTVDPNGTPGYSYGYIAVSGVDNIMSAFSNTADFTTLSGGTYKIYGIHYDTSTDMNSYVGQIFFDYYQSGDCFQVCDNPFQLDIEGSCKIQGATIETASNCNPSDNSFTQDIIINFNELPSTGNIMANGQSFAITGNPMTIAYVAQSNGESETLSINFSEEPTCIVSVNFTHKDNCCTFDIPFSGTHTICEGEEYDLDAGDGANGGGSYLWKKDNVDLAFSDKTLTVSEAGIYSVQVTSATGCPKMESIEILVTTAPTLTVPLDFSICENESSDIIATTNGTDIKWYENSVIISGEINSSLNISSGGTYIIVSSNAANCTSTDTVIVDQIAAPIVNLGDDRTTCIGNEEILTAPTGTNYTYEWIEGTTVVSTDPNYTVTTNSILMLVVTNGNMCSSSDEVSISFEPGPTLSIDNTMVLLCEGDNITITATTDASSISWLKDDVIISGETATTLIVNQTGVYTALVEGTSGCKVEKKATVFVNPNPSVDLPASATGCEGDILTLVAGTTATEYQWIHPTGATHATTQTTEITDPGSYQLIVTNEFNCTATDAIEVDFTTRPIISLPSELDICEGSTETITATSNGSTHQWKKDGVDINGETNISLDISESGSYTLIAFNGSDCADEATITVTTRAAPAVDLGSGHTVCPGEEISLDANNTGSTYLWDNGETSQTITIPHPGDVISETTLTISVEVVNQFNCTTTTETNITFYPNINAQIDGDMGVCLGDTISLTASGGQMFEWTGSNSSSTSGETILVYPSETTTYSVEVTDIQCSGQTESTSFEVEVYLPDEDITGGDDKVVIVGREVSLSGSGGTSYIWSPDSTIVSGQGTANPVVNPTEETIYSVIISDINGCTKIDSVLVTLIDDPLSLLKHVTIITPNDDGLNDYLEFIGLESFPHNTIDIYNRWGETIFTASDYQLNGQYFDGTRNGKELPADTYFYVLKFDGNIIKERITIVRPK